MCLWCDKNLYEIEEARLHPKKLTVWVPPSGHMELLVQFFFFFLCKTVKSESYHKLLSEDGTS